MISFYNHSCYAKQERPIRSKHHKTIFEKATLHSPRKCGDLSTYRYRRFSVNRRRRRYIRFVPYRTVSLEQHINVWNGLSSLVRLLAGVDPIWVDIDRLGQVVDGRLEVLQTDATGNESDVSVAIAEIWIVIDMRIIWFNYKVFFYINILAYSVNCTCKLW